jgi:hypothetical protein
VLGDQLGAGHSRVAIAVDEVKMALDENVAKVPTLAGQGEAEKGEDPGEAEGGFHAREKKTQIIDWARYILWCSVLFTAIPWGFPHFLGKKSVVARVGQT